MFVCSEGTVFSVRFSENTPKRVSAPVSCFSSPRPNRTWIFISNVIHSVLKKDEKPERSCVQAFHGRGRRLRTLGLRFWRPSLYQLSYSPIWNWWAFRDLNPGPTGYEPVALTNWAKGPYSKIAATGVTAISMAPPVGFEPTTLRLTAACSTCWAKEA